MYVRCPFDKSNPIDPRVFLCGIIKSIDEFKQTAVVAFNDPFSYLQYFPDLGVQSLEYPISSVQRCVLFNDSVVSFEGSNYLIKGMKKREDGYFEYYIQSMKTKEYKSACETELIASFNNGKVTPISQLKRYEFQNPVWFFGRNTVSKNIELLNNSTLGFKELAGSKIFLLPHQINTIMRCLQDTNCRYMLADEVGMGKTIEAISILKIYLMTRSSQSVLVIVPDSLVEQWKTEMFFKFNISIGRNRNANMIHIVPFSKIQSVNCNESYSFVVIDEAHRVVRDQELYRRLLSVSENAANILLLSATPVQDRKEEYLDLLRLLQPKRYGRLSLEIFEELIEKQKKIVQKTSLVLNDLVDYIEAIEETEDEDPHNNEDCIDLYDEMLEMLDEVISGLNDEKLQSLLEKIHFDSDDLGVYAMKVLISYICSNYQIENNIIRNRRKMLETEDGKALLPKRKLQKLEYNMNECDSSYESQVYEELLNYFEHNIEKTDENVETVIKPLLSAFFSSSFAFNNVLKELVSKNEDTGDLFEYAARWNSFETYIIDNISDILDDPDQYEPYYSCRLVQVFNHLFNECFGTKTVLFTDFQETFNAYETVLESVFDENETAFFCASQKADDNELSAYRFQNNTDCCYMLCDSTGGEGRNFQCADYVVHIDLPWDANAIEQRIGRLDRLERDPKRNIVTSIVPYAFDSFEASLFKFWNEGLNIFQQSLSGMEIIMQDINSDIKEAVKKDLKYGLYDRIEKIISRVEKIRKEIVREQNYDAASFIFKPMYNQLNRLVQFYNRYENELFANTMEAWASLAGFHGSQNSQGITTYGASSFSYQSAVNTLLIPPKWELYQNDKQSLFQTKIQEQAEMQKKNSVKERVIRGTFNRREAIENDYLHFFAPGDPIFDCIVDNAIRNCKGQVCACRVNDLINWTGLVFTWRLSMNEQLLLDHGVSMYAIGQYRTFLPAKQVVTVFDLDNPDNVSEENVKKVFQKIANLPLNDVKKYVKHVGKRGDQSLKNFKLEYPKEVWQSMVDEAYKDAKNKAVAEYKKHINLKGAKEEMQRSLSAMTANSEYYGLNNGDLDTEKNKLDLIYQSLKECKITLESAAFLKVVKKDV